MDEITNTTASGGRYQLNILYLNMSKAPFNDTAFRRAIGYAINRIRSAKKPITVSYRLPINGIIPGQQATGLTHHCDITYSYDPAKAREILSEAGYTWDSAGALVDPSGAKVPAVRILVGAGWTDFISMAQLISEDMKAIGVTMVIEQEPWNSYINSLMGGTYDTAICWGTGSGSTPYDLYYRTLASEFGGKDGGQAESNYSRFASEVVDQALATYRASSDPDEQWQAIATIQREVLTKVPYIPLTDRSHFNCYQTATLAGWPTADNPYNGGEPAMKSGPGDAPQLASALNSLQHWRAGCLRQPPSSADRRTGMRYLLRRIGFLLFTGWAALSINFIVPHLMPGNPAQVMLAKFQGRLSPQALGALTEAFGLNTDKSLFVQYLDYWKRILSGDFGISLTYYPSPVTEVLAQSVPWTLGLVGCATIIAFTLGTLLGIFSAWRRNSALADGLVPVALFFNSIPYFWLSLLVLYLFAYYLGWFPIAGGYDIFSMATGLALLPSIVYHAVLPLSTIVITALGGWLLTMRNNMISVRSDDYVAFAYAKGLPDWEIKYRYAAQCHLPSITGFLCP